MIVATKYTANYKSGGKASKHPISINRCVSVEHGLSRLGTGLDVTVLVLRHLLRSGNSYKSMYVSLEDSLKKLQTTYVDILCACPRRTRMLI